jgi:hypothetical protein
MTASEKSATLLRVPAKSSPALIARAKELDAKIHGALMSLKKEFFQLSKAMAEMRDMQLHRFIRREGSKKHYISFDEYVGSLTSGDISRATIFHMLKVGTLMIGPDALPLAEVEKMSARNAAKLADLPPRHRTKKVIEAAQEMTHEIFQAQLPRHLAEQGATAEEIENVVPEKVTFARTWARPVVEKLKEALEDGALIPGIRDGDRSLTLEEKVIYAMCVFFVEAHADDIREGRRLTEIDAEALNGMTDAEEMTADEEEIDA